MNAVVQKIFEKEAFVALLLSLVIWAMSMFCICFLTDFCESAPESRQASHSIVMKS